MRGRIVCWLKGCRYERKTYDRNGRRVEIDVCVRCHCSDPSSLVISPRNRRMRREWARSVAKEIAR